MDIKKEDLNSENVCQLVWAKMRYCPYWPARVVETPPELLPTPSKKVCVLFFGTKQFGFVDNDNIMEYNIHRAKFVGKGRGADFKNAIQEMDKFISDPAEFRLNAYAKPIQRRIKIKTERVVEQQLGIKKEPADSIAIGTNDVNANSKSNTWQQEKQSLVQKCMSMKAENQKLLFEMKKKQSEYESLVLHNEALKKKLNDQTSKVDALENKLLIESSKHDEMIAKNKKSILDLRRDNKTLTARNKQLQCGIDQYAITPNDKNGATENGIYEVDKIVGHKNKNGVSYYLVRWKGYTAEDDTWENKSNLLCPTILDDYTKSLEKAKNK